MNKILYTRPFKPDMKKKLSILLLLVFLLISCKSKPGVIPEPIEVKEPEFEVVSIIILQADLVVTEFETVLRVKNPNEFDVELSSFTYELFANGNSWGSGAADRILNIPALSSGETSIIFSMNFINMSRRLLDDVIAMRQVNYRFRGTAEVQPDITNRQGVRIRNFMMNYDCSGLSEVRRR